MEPNELAELTEIVQRLQSVLTKLTAKYQLPLSPKSEKTEFYVKSTPVKELGPTPVVSDENWPRAVYDDAITEDSGVNEKRYRAMQVIGTFGVSIAGKKILDYGCGDGFVTSEMANQADVIGYDILENAQWSEFKKTKFTTDFAKVQSGKPYDFILLYDVLDQVKGTNPLELLVSLRECLADNGTLYVHTHPWTSRHGGELYNQLNKAYVHLALTTDELIDLGITPKHNIKVSRPMAAYEKLFTDAGFDVVSKNIKSEEVDEYIRIHLLDRIIKLTWCGSIDREQAVRIMNNQFINYYLRKK